MRAVLVDTSAWAAITDSRTKMDALAIGNFLVEKEYRLKGCSRQENGQLAAVDEALNDLLGKLIKIIQLSRKIVIDNARIDFEVVVNKDVTKAHHTNHVARQILINNIFTAENSKDIFRLIRGRQTKLPDQVVRNIHTDLDG